MADNDKTLEYLLLGVIAGGFLTFLAMTINNQLQLLNQNLSTYNQSLLYQPQYSYAQLPQIQQQPEPVVIQSVPTPKLVPKKLYNVQFDDDGFITDLNSTG